MSDSATETSLRPGAPVIRYYFYALREQLPLDDDWLMTAHEYDAGRGHREYRCGFLKIEGIDIGLNQATHALDLAVQRLKTVDGSSEVEPARASPEPPPNEQPFFVAVAAATLFDGEDPVAHREECFERLRVILGGLTLATKAPVHELTIERVWPLYLVGQSIQGQPPQITTLVIVEHGMHGPQPANEKQLEQAGALADARAQGHPTETYRHFEHAAAISFQCDGDYISTVLNAATATEILIKHLSWMLTWEATTKLANDPQPDAIPDDLLRAEPRKLIGTVLSRRLRGDWNSKDESKPVGFWRQNIARQRNMVVHNGRRPNSAVAEKAVKGIDRLENHLLDRLIDNVRVYPHTALLLVGRESLVRRAVWDQVAELSARAQSEPSWLGQYLNWLGQQAPLAQDAE